MIEKTILDYLNTQLSAPAYMEMPKSPTAKFVLIEKTGSGITNHIGNAVFAIQSHADTLYKAALLNESVKTAMLGAVSLEEIASVRLNSDYNYTDGATKDYRYQAVFDLTHYEV